MKRVLFLVISIICCCDMLAVNDTETVSIVRSDRTLDTAKDLVITGTSKCIYNSTVDIECEDAAIVFENVKPSDVISNYLDKITIYGSPAKRFQNCRVSIYRHGSIVMPFGRSFKALTVYSDADFCGDSCQFAQGSVQNNLGEWNNRIKSFRLKRGYMVTFANHTDGTGYSHCYIADKENLEINLPKEMAGRVSMLRVFHWQWPAKKGVSDLNGETSRSALNASWFYTWGAGDNSRIDAEAVPMRHHETGSYYPGGTTTDQWAWPGFDEINSRDETVTHVLGNNEPDNVGSGEVYKTPEELIEIHKEYLASGMRIGTFACCNPNTDWINRYLTLVREQNMRCDFVATHYYIGGQSPENVINSLRSLHDVSGLPVWCTEWNNGANWTGESSFYTDSEGWYTWGNGDDNRKNGVFITDVLKRADNEKWLERMSVFSNVESKRMLWENDALTAGGKLYADYKSDFAYDSSNEYFMKWNYYAPSDLKVTYDKTKNTATLNWTNSNTDLTNSALVQVYRDDEWETIATLPMDDSESMSYTVDVSGWEAGFHTFRVRNHDADGSKRRTTNEAGFDIAKIQTAGCVQYGRLNIMSEDYITTDLEGYADAPIVVMGMISNANKTNGITMNLKSTEADNFICRLVPWQYNSPVTIAKKETVDFIAIPQGVYSFDDGKKIIAGKTGSVKDKDVRITFDEPFPEGEIPVVVGQNIYTRTSISPTTVRISDVDNTGFTARLVRQEAETSNLSGQKINYIAISQGRIGLGMGKMLTGYRDNSSPVGGGSSVSVVFTRDDEDARFVEPFLVGGGQTNNYAKASIIRQTINSVSETDGGGDMVTYVSKLSLTRQCDPTSSVSTKDAASDNGDYAGWIILSDDPEGNSSDPAVLPSTYIKDISETPENKAIYNLQGQKLAYPQRGVNIINGRKYLMK